MGENGENNPTRRDFLRFMTGGGAFLGLGLTGCGKQEKGSEVVARGTVSAEDNTVSGKVSGDDTYEEYWSETPPKTIVDDLKERVLSRIASTFGIEDSAEIELFKSKDEAPRGCFIVNGTLYVTTGDTSIRPIYENTANMRQCELREVSPSIAFIVQSALLDADDIYNMSGKELKEKIEGAYQELSEREWVLNENGDIDSKEIPKQDRALTSLRRWEIIETEEQFLDKLLFC